MYPDDSLQGFIEPSAWWVEQKEKSLCRGALIFAFIPHVDQVPYTIKPVGRNRPDDHSTADIELAPLRINQPRNRTDLPVAAMSLNDREIVTGYRAKKRPCLVIGSDLKLIESSNTRGMPNRNTAPTVIVAPYYGIDQDGTRAGYNPQFVELVRHCVYPQFVWDMLPIGGPKESLLRLDHLQPVGTHYNSYELSGYILGDDALNIIDELINCLIYGGLPENGYVAMYREAMEEILSE